MIKVHNLKGGYGDQAIIKGISFTIDEGEFFALIGPNGSGKSTVFKLLTGLLPFQEGHVDIAGKNLVKYSTLEKARMIAVLAQEEYISFDYTVEEIINLGRYSHQKGLFKTLLKQDREVVEEAMKVTGVTRYRDHPFRFLSGGEKQRVLLAKAFAQEPKILLLDEPTNHLDIQHTFQLLNLLKKWQKSKKVTIFAILHDVNIASLYADRLALLDQGKLAAVGDFQTLNMEKQLKQVYHVQLLAQAHPNIPTSQFLLNPKQLSPEQSVAFKSLYRLQQNEQMIQLQFGKPVKTLSNGMIGGGFKWLCHFKLRVVDFHKKSMWTKEMKECTYLMMMTADHQSHHMMIFIDGKLTDAAFVDLFMKVTEAKTKALVERGGKDERSNQSAGILTDSLLVGATQRGTDISSGPAKQELEKELVQMVYEATNMVINGVIS